MVNPWVPLLLELRHPSSSHGLGELIVRSLLGGAKPSATAFPRTGNILLGHRQTGMPEGTAPNNLCRAVSHGQDDHAAQPRGRQEDHDHPVPVPGRLKRLSGDDCLVPGHRFVIRPIDNDEDAAVRCQFQPRTEDWQDTLLVEIEPPSEQRRLPRAWAARNSTVPATVRDWNPEDKDFLKDTDPTPDHWSGRIDVPKISQQLLGPNAGIRITVTPRAIALGDI
jgi:hypothetical protein